MNQAESTPQDNQMGVDITIWPPFQPRMSFLTPQVWVFNPTYLIVLQKITDF